jgi:hypothetical protein
MRHQQVLEIMIPQVAMMSQNIVQVVLMRSSFRLAKQATSLYGFLNNNCAKTRQ